MKAEFRPPFSKDRKPLHDLLPLDTPISVYIDPCNICNFSCKFCYQRVLTGGGGGHKNKLNMPNKTKMKTQLFEKIVNDLKNFPSKVKIIHLYGLGEPLLNENLPDMIKLLKSSNVVERIEITTNGSLFTEKNMRDIIDAGIDQIHISIYGLSQEKYREFCNNGVNFAKFTENVKNLYGIKKNCHIHIKITGDYFSDEEKKSFLETFGDYCDTIFIDNAANIWPGLDIKDAKNKNTVNHMYCQEVIKDKICPNLFYQMFIHPDGIVSPCCVDFGQKAKIGDVTQNNLRDIWNGDFVNSMRINHLKGIKNYGACKDCIYPSEGSTVNINPYVDDLLAKYEAIVHSKDK